MGTDGPLPQYPRHYPTESNAFFTYSISIQCVSFQVQPTRFQKIKRIQKNLDKVFHLSIVIYNTTHILHQIRI